MRLLNKSANKTTDLQNILTYVSKSFANASEECKLAIYDADSQLNPLWAFSYSRNSLAASASLIEKFVERNDPRAPQAFLEPDPSGYTSLPAMQVVRKLQTSQVSKRLLTEPRKSCRTIMVCQ